MPGSETEEQLQRNLTSKSKQGNVPHDKRCSDDVESGSQSLDEESVLYRKKKRLLTSRKIETDSVIRKNESKKPRINFDVVNMTKNLNGVKSNDLNDYYAHSSCSNDHFNEHHRTGFFSHKLNYNQIKQYKTIPLTDSINSLLNPIFTPFTFPIFPIQYTDSTPNVLIYYQHLLSGQPSVHSRDLPTTFSISNLIDKSSSNETQHVNNLFLPHVTETSVSTHNFRNISLAHGSLSIGQNYTLECSNENINKKPADEKCKTSQCLLYDRRTNTDDFYNTLNDCSNKVPHEDPIDLSISNGDRKPHTAVNEIIFPSVHCTLGQENRSNRKSALISDKSSEPVALDLTQLKEETNLPI